MRPRYRHAEAFQTLIYSLYTLTYFYQNLLDQTNKSPYVKLTCFFSATLCATPRQKIDAVFWWFGVTVSPAIARKYPPNFRHY